MVRWHHRLNGHEFGWALGVGVGQGGLSCCDSWGHKESDMTERLHRTELKVTQLCIYIDFFKLFSIIVNHRVLNIVACVIQ